MPSKSLREKTEELLRQTRQLREQLVTFKRSAGVVAGPLNRAVSDEEATAMVTPRANALGTLENLLYQDLDPVLRQLDELATCLKDDSAPGL